MENQQGNQNQEIVQAEIDSTENKKIQKKLSLKFIFIFSGISFLIAFLIGGLVLGTYGIKKASKITPTPIVKVSPTPTPGPTANWKIYTDQKYGYSIEYPPNLSTKETIPNVFVEIIDNTDKNEIVSITNIDMENKSGEQVVLEDFAKTAGPLQYEGYESLHEMKSIMSTSKIKGYETTWNTNFSEVMNVTPGMGVSNPITYFPFPNPNIYGAVAIELKDKNFETIYDQILSTFKFLPVSPTGGDQNQGVACAQDAKQCPDGSYVSRDPSNNCNFKECPK